MCGGQINFLSRQGGNMHHELSIHESISVTDSQDADIRYSLQWDLLNAASFCARRARELQASANPGSEQEHRTMVLSCLHNAVAALHAEGVELSKFRTEGLIDNFDLQKLAPHLKALDRRNPADRIVEVLSILGRSPIPQSLLDEASLLVTLRNDIVHYESEWESSPTRRAQLRQEIRAKSFSPPPWETTGRYPLAVLGADCAEWGARTVIAMLDAFYSSLAAGTPRASNRIDAHAGHARL